MADTALKFGPEWLRALTEPQGGSDGGGLLYSPVSVLPNMKLAEFRYGREEMLALFDKAVKHPEQLAQFGSLFVEKTQFPLNLLQMGEEESRAWQRGANSDASLRPFGGPPGKRPPSPTGGRGRGRGRGANLPYYDRNRSMDDDLEGRVREREAPSVDRGFPRGRGGGSGVAFDRQTSERGWFDRSDRQAAREEEMNGAVSPRKGYTRAPFDDWRRGGEGGGQGQGPPEPGQGDSAEGWRTSGRRWGGAGTGLSQGQGWRSAAGDRENNYTRSKYGEAPGGGRGDRWKREGDGERNGGGGRGVGARNGARRHELPEWAHDDPTGESGSFDHEGKWRPSEREMAGREEWGEEGGARWEEEEVDPEDLDNGKKEERGERRSEERRGGEGERSRQKSGGKEQSAPRNDWEGGEPSPNMSNGSSKGGGGGHQEPRHKTSGDHLEYMAGSLVDSLVNDPEEELRDPGRVGSAAAPSVSPPSANPPSATPPSLPPALPKAFEWSYLDPQGQQQGPFQSDEMFEWFSAGYFPADLMVKRDCDLRFLSLTEVSSLYGRNPFTPGPAPPPLADREEEGRRRREEEEARRRREEEDRLKQQQQLMVQQMLMQQHQQQLLAQQHQQHLLAMQQQQQQQQQQHAPSPHLQQFGGGHPLLGGLGLGGVMGGGDPGRAGYPSPDPLRSLLGTLHNNTPPEQQQQDPLKALLARQQQQQHYTTASPSMPHAPAPAQQRAPSSLFSGPSPPAPSQGGGFDPIQSLLQQLQGGSGGRASSSPPAQPQPPLPPTSDTQYMAQQQHFQRPGPAAGHSIWDLAEPEQEQPCQEPPPAPAGPHHLLQEAPAPPAAPSVWNSAPARTSPELSPDPTTDSGTEDLDPLQEPELETSEAPENDTSFVKPKSNEKKDKKSKKAEEKRKAKEKAKKDGEAGPYIPGMSSVKPEEQVVAQGNVLDLRVEDERRAGQEAQAAQRAQVEALARLQEDQRLRLEREEQLRLQQERLAKLAPWAKKEQEGSRTEGDQLSLAEIQRREAEREREQRAAQEVLEARGREEARWREEEERRQRAAKTINWATVSGGSGAAKVKSLAEIQAEEARVEKERQEKESASRSARQGSAGGGGVWGGSKATSWAGKIAASSPAPAPRSNGNPWNSAPAQASTAAVVAPAGFWDPVVPEQESRSSGQAPNSTVAGKKNKKNKNKKMEEEAKVKQIFGEKKPKNDFEDWCTRSLQSMQAQVDIPTFLGFLMDIESPYEVHDYIKSYVGEEKAQKKFAVDYLERRSRWKRALKGGAAYEDDLTTPAHAITPGLEDEFKEAGKKGKKPGKASNTKVKGKQDMSHLLGFSVSGQGVNRGELDMPH